MAGLENYFPENSFYNKGGPERDYSEKKEKIEKIKVSSMKVIYAQEPVEIIGKSIFLAGPTPRSETVESWRDDALAILEIVKFDGTVFVPEMNGGWNRDFEYATQIEWEEECLNKADVILFWIPRDLETLPGFTTNIEWGYWTAKNPSKLVLGIPKDTVKSDYLIYYADKLGIPFSNSLDTTIINSLKKVK